MNLSSVPCPLSPVFILFRPAEKKAFRRRKRLPGPQWAERNIYVPVGSRQGLYRNHNNPPLYGILEMAGRPYVRTIVLAKAIQTGGTLAFYALLLREADYSGGGDNALIVMADERSVKKLSKKRLQPMIDKSPTLGAIKSGNPDDTTIYNITLADGFSIDIGWASSEMSVSSESYRVLVLDEISKYTVRGNIQDAKGRTTVYPDTKKVFIFSSPAVDTDDPNNRDPLMEEAEACDVIMEYHVQCPDCGADQVMTDENIKYPMQQGLPSVGGLHELPLHAADSAAIRRLKLAYYECPHCKSRWNDYQRDKVVLKAMKHGWQAIDKTIDHPQSIYFHYPAWLSPFMSLSECAARRIEAQGDEEKTRKYENLVGGRTWRPEIKGERKGDQIMALRDDRPRGLVPSDADILLAGIDTQQRGFYFEVRAFQYGFQLESAQVREGFAENFAELAKALWENEYADINDKKYPVAASFIDSGGTTGDFGVSRTHEVYEFCYKNRHHKIYPIKGFAADPNNPRTEKLVRKEQEYYPGTKRKIPGLLVRYNLHVNYFKNWLADKLSKTKADPGAWIMHSEITDNYARQMCVEYSDARGFWLCPRGKPNHYWDCSVYLIALAEMMQLKMRRKPAEGEQQQTSRRILSKGVQQ